MDVDMDCLIVEEGMYVYNNEDLVLNNVCVLDQVKLYIQKILKVNISNVLYKQLDYLR